MTKSRGRELPGTFNPLIIGELFTEQCQPWRAIVLDTKKSIIQKVYVTIHAILDHIAVDETTEGIFRIISGRIDSLKGDLDQRVANLLDPHYTVHPITYNHYLTDNVQKAQADRRRQKFERNLINFMGLSSVKDESSIIVKAAELLSLLEESTETDMERYASDLAVDYMQAYYKVRSQRRIPMV
jgi:hypothetical protein